MKRLYLLVSEDKYELPLVVADTVPELAGIVGVDPQSIYQRLRGVRRKEHKRSKYVEVAYDEEEYDEIRRVKKL